MSLHQYIGARYVPIFYQNSLDPTSTEWEANVTYEPMTWVSTLNGNMYLSKKTVPANAGDPASTPEYWMEAGQFNAYIQSLQDQINDMNDGSVNGSLQNQINTMNDGNVSGSLQNQIDNISLESLSDNQIMWPTNNTLGTTREEFKIEVSNDHGFVDNVLAIQNDSHGPFSGNPDVYGNAAISFFDSTGTERSAVGFSRDSTAQPSGYVADTMYIEGGNPFGANHDTDIRFIMSNSTGFGGQFIPLEVISTTGEFKIKARGNKHVEIINGLNVANVHDSAYNAVISPVYTYSRVGITTNIESAETFHANDINKLSMSVSIGNEGGSQFGTSWHKGLVISKNSFDSDTSIINGITIFSEMYDDGRLYHGGNHSYNSYAFNGAVNISTFTNAPALCLKNEATNQPAMTVWCGSAANYVFAEFQYGATIDSSSLKGSIDYAVGSGTVRYNTTSDYRIKHDLKETADALTKIKNIKIYNGLIGEGTERLDFVLAHELQEVIPYAVSGEKDAVDDNGNMVLQMVDYTKLIPLIIEAIKELSDGKNNN